MSTFDNPGNLEPGGRDESREWRRDRWRNWGDGHHDRSIFFPILLIAIGVFMLLDLTNLVAWSSWDMLWRLWPLLFVVGGLDGLYRRDGFVGPLVSIGIGVVFLLGNFGYLQTSAWRLLLQLWPVLLIAWGLDLLVGRRGMVSAAVGVLIGLALLGGIVWFAVVNPSLRAAVSTEGFEQPLGDVDKGDVRIETIFTDLSVDGGAAVGNLVDGEVSAMRNNGFDMEYRTREDTGIFVLRPQRRVNVVFLGDPGRNPWQVNLSDEIPLELESQVIMGSQEVDLDGLQIDRLDVETVMGSTVLALGDQAEYKGDVSTVMGEVVIVVPAGVEVVIETDLGMTAVNLPEGFTRQGDRIHSDGAVDGDPVTVHVSLPIGFLQVRYAD